MSFRRQIWSNFPGEVDDNGGTWARLRSDRHRHVRVCSCTRVLMYACAHVRVCSCTRVLMYACAHVRVCSCTRVTEDLKLKSGKTEAVVKLIFSPIGEILRSIAYNFCLKSKAGKLYVRLAARHHGSGQWKGCGEAATFLLLMLAWASIRGTSPVGDLPVRRAAKLHFSVNQFSP